MDEHIDTDIAPYDLWQSEGLITVTGGLNEYKNDYKFIINHLNIDTQRQTTLMRHWIPKGAMTWPLVK